MKEISVDQLQRKTGTGLQIKPFKANYKLRPNGYYSIPHRDDHYIFFLLTSGSGILTVDLHDITIKAGHLYYILPTQVHTRIRAGDAVGWFIAIDTSLIPPDLKEVFDNRFVLQMPCKLSDHEINQYSNLLSLLHTESVHRQGDKFYLLIIRTLVQSFLGMAASTYNCIESSEVKNTRSTQLARKFKALLVVHIRDIKKPSVYASWLNVSTGYLNEAIKKDTGSTVSYWIQQEVFTQAKRLLMYSDSDVKEIAYKLGYHDHSYFIRLFRKEMGLTPVKFKSLNRITT